MRHPSNPRLQSLIKELKTLSQKEKVAVWKRIASDLEKPNRNRRAVNLSRISHHAKENESVVVPGKVLGTGELSRKVTIAAFSISSSAKEKVGKDNFLTIEELMQKNPKGKNVRIIG
ncbi:MAG: 50S ribosomal protein L18e [archaeon]